MRDAVSINLEELTETVGRGAGHAVVMESSGHTFDATVSTKVLAPWTTSTDSANGDPAYFEELLSRCSRAG